MNWKHMLCAALGAFFCAGVIVGVILATVILTGGLP